MGEGVTLALDLLKKRKQEYKDKGVDYYQPWLAFDDRWSTEWKSRTVK